MHLSKIHIICDGSDRPPNCQIITQKIITEHMLYFFFFFLSYIFFVFFTWKQTKNNNNPWGLKHSVYNYIYIEREVTR